MTPAPSKASLHYRNIFTSRTEEELDTIALVKRFMERLVGDEEFRKKLNKNHETPNPVAIEYGIDIDLMQALPLWHNQYAKYRFKPELEKEWPLADAFDRYINQMRQHRTVIREQGDMSKSNSRFHAWRERQIARSASEIPGNYEAITHPIISFELSQGCSVGCWFCGISAGQFQGYYPYTEEHSTLWQEILGSVSELFGEAAHTGFCYWATDPSDNPDYPKFINDYYQITGYLPQTTTAAPLKNVALTREIMALFNQYRCVTNRFSVTTLRQLNLIHQTFTPRELLGVELVTQNKESLNLKAMAGRAIERKKRLQAAGRNDEISKLKGDHATIACVSGFLVSMMKQNIQLVSPCRSCEQWPLGYRIYDERHFDTGEEFRAILQDMIEQFMPESVPDESILSFRKDLNYIAPEDGRTNTFKLKSPYVEHNCNGMPFMARLGELIAGGRLSAKEIIKQLAPSDAQANLVSSALQHFFVKGLLNDDPAYDGIATQRKLA
jgi:radical SAM family RiPP maturation amino acid epimerase